jgi:triphosphoribosyl-dephospho-CoA synthetase
MNDLPQERSVMLTSIRDYGAQARTASGTNIALGIWLMASPWIFDYSGRSAVVGSVFCGALIALLAAVRIASLHNSVGLSAVNLLLALWTLASPWIWGYMANFGGMANSVVLGLLIAALAAWSGCASRADERRYWAR